MTDSLLSCVWLTETILLQLHNERKNLHVNLAEEYHLLHLCTADKNPRTSISKYYHSSKLFDDI